MFSSQAALFSTEREHCYAAVSVVKGMEEANSDLAIVCRRNRAPLPELQHRPDRADFSPGMENAVLTVQIYRATRRLRGRRPTRIDSITRTATCLFLTFLSELPCLHGKTFDTNNIASA